MNVETFAYLRCGGWPLHRHCRRSKCQWLVQQLLVGLCWGRYTG
jgi:hypothetical protein